MYRNMIASDRIDLDGTCHPTNDYPTSLRSMLGPTIGSLRSRKPRAFDGKSRKNITALIKLRIRKAHFSGIMLDPSAGLFPGKRGPVAVFDANDLDAKLTEQNLRSRNILSIWRINL
jgi:hypothetical protein